MKRKKRKYTRRAVSAAIDEPVEEVSAGTKGTEACPACNGKKYIVHQGMEFPCPTCRKPLKK